LEIAMKRKFFVTSLLLVSAACTSPTPNPAPAVPPSLKPAATEQLFATLAARGVQIYECRAKKDDPRSTQWAFVAPQADLFDAQGRLVGKHYAGPKWESLDGSKVAGSVKASADAPRAAAIPWLLLTTRSEGPDGAFAKTTSIQRINTVGGLAPAADDCSTATLGKGARVDYTADYMMFGSK
jgi:Protein of unknown function (DUF3455)